MYRSSSDCSSELKEGFGYIEEIQERYPEIRVIDPNSVICQRKICNPIADGILLYRDNGHLTDLGSRLIGEKLMTAGVKL